MIAVDCFLIISHLQQEEPEVADEPNCFNNEGSANSLRGSLSSIETTDSANVDFSYLKDWGPKFSKVAKTYQQDES